MEDTFRGGLPVAYHSSELASYQLCIKSVSLAKQWHSGANKGKSKLFKTLFWKHN